MDMGCPIPVHREVPPMLANVMKIALLAVILASSSGCIIHHFDDDDDHHRGGWDDRRDHDDRDRDGHRKGHR